MTIAGIEPTRLMAHVRSIEILEEQKKHLSAEIADAYEGAEGDGIDKKALRKLIARRRKNRAELEHEDELIVVLESALEQAEQTQDRRAAE
jgi:uncharacterized protein (UPF0335 family)